jgi:hypothetical protein
MAPVAILARRSMPFVEPHAVKHGRILTALFFGRAMLWPLLFLYHLDSLI